LVCPDYLVRLLDPPVVPPVPVSPPEPTLPVDPVLPPVAPVLLPLAVPAPPPLIPPEAPPLPVDDPPEAELPPVTAEPVEPLAPVPDWSCWVEAPPLLPVAPELPTELPLAADPLPLLLDCANAAPANASAMTEAVARINCLICSSPVLDRKKTSLPESGSSITAHTLKPRL
jgi:hypothetical protein